MADSSEKVSFRVDMQCSSLRAEAFLVFDKGSQPTLGQQITVMRPTVGRLLEKDFRKSGKRQLVDSWPTVKCRLFGRAVLHFFPCFCFKAIIFRIPSCFGLSVIIALPTSPNAYFTPSRKVSGTLLSGILPS